MYFLYFQPKGEAKLIRMGQLQGYLTLDLAVFTALDLRMARLTVIDEYERKSKRGGKPVPPMMKGGYSIYKGERTRTEDVQAVIRV